MITAPIKGSQIEKQMRKIYVILPLACALTFTACDDYDDTALWEQVNDNTGRIEALEEWQQTTNSNIAALQQLISTTDYITSVTPVTENGKEIGYTITFLHSDPITIYHGEKGDKGEDGTAGSTPQIGLTQQTDGNWYWTLNGELMTDSKGNPIRANGEDGKDGEDGQDGTDGDDGSTGATGRPGASAPTPQIKLGNTLTTGTYYGIDGDKQTTPDTGAWYLSVDNGATWYRVSGEDGQSGSTGDSFFKKVDTSNPNYVTFTLTDGTSFQVPCYQSLTIGDGTGTLVLTGTTTEIKLTLPNGTTTSDYSALVAQITPEGADGTYTDIDTRADNAGGWSVTGDLENSTVTVTAGSGTALLRATLIRNDGGEVMASRVVENLGYTISEDGKTYTVYNADGLIAWANAVNAEKGQYRYTNCILTADINMQGETWAGVCTGNSEWFAGTFDGGGHTISNLTYTCEQDASFIKKASENCIIKNVTFKNLEITATSHSAGGIIKQASGSTTVINCHVVGGKVISTGLGQAGGIIGFITSENVKVYACSSSAEIKSQSWRGGIVGDNGGNYAHKGGTIIACYATGNVVELTPNNVSNAAGVIAGANYGTITSCYWANSELDCGYNVYEEAGAGGKFKEENKENKVTEGNWDNAITAMNNALTSVGISGYTWVKNTDNDANTRPLTIKMD